MITLTLDRIFDCRTANGGWTKSTVEACGMRWMDMTPGWPRRLVGRDISEQDWQHALAGKCVFKSRKAGRQSKCEELGAHPDSGTPAPGGW